MSLPLLLIFIFNNDISIFQCRLWEDFDAKLQIVEMIFVICLIIFHVIFYLDFFRIEIPDRIKCESDRL